MLRATAVQAHLAQLALGDIFAALEVHQDQADLQAKGLVALGVLGQVRGMQPSSHSSPQYTEETSNCSTLRTALTCCSTCVGCVCVCDDPLMGASGLVQGDGATHDHIRSMQLQIGVPSAIARALQQWGSSSDEVCSMAVPPPTAFRASDSPCLAHGQHAAPLLCYAVSGKAAQSSSSTLDMLHGRLQI